MFQRIVDWFFNRAKPVEVWQPDDEFKARVLTIEKVSSTDGRTHRKDLVDKGRHKDQLKIENWLGLGWKIVDTKLVRHKTHKKKKRRH